MKITPQSTLKEVMATPVGNDLVAMVAYHAGIPDKVIHNPVVGNMRLTSIQKLLGDKLPMETVEHLCKLLGYTPEKVITKDEVENSDSFLAQGGICVLHDKDDYDSFMEDTLKAGHYENRRESVDIMIRSSRPVIDELIGYGVDFARKADGSLDYTREGCHSRARILFHEDITGKEITSHLLAAVRQLPNVTIRDFTTMVDIVTDGKRLALVDNGCIQLSTVTGTGCMQGALCAAFLSAAAPLDAATAASSVFGICGELAADLSLTETFLRMGIDELSVSPAFVLKVRDTVRKIRLK